MEGRQTGRGLGKGGKRWAGGMMTSGQKETLVVKNKFIIFVYRSRCIEVYSLNTSSLVYANFILKTRKIKGLLKKVLGEIPKWLLPSWQHNNSSSPMNKFSFHLQCVHYLPRSQTSNMESVHQQHPSDGYTFSSFNAMTSPFSTFSFPSHCFNLSWLLTYNQSAMPTWSVSKLFIFHSCGFWLS